MAKLKKTWREKLAEGKDLAKVVEITESMSKRWGEGTVVIPAPREVDEIMRRVPRGRLMTVNQIRETVARKHEATIGCPITTGIFIGIAAKAAEESAAEGGGGDITPYWRTLKVGGELNPKYPGGVEAQAARLEEEGHTIDRRRKTPRVQDHEGKLVEV